MGEATKSHYCIVTYSPDYTVSENDTKFDLQLLENA